MGGEDGGGMNPVVFSASSVNAYLDCHLRWYFTYVLNEPGEQSEAQAVGIAVHDHAEKRLRGEPANIERMPVKTFWAVTAANEVFDRDILPTYRDPVLIEAEFQIDINGIPFSGIIDAVDRHDYPPLISLLMPFPQGQSINVLRDLKTTGKRPPPGRYRFNMVGYWLGARELGYECQAMMLDYVVRTQTPYYWPESIPIPDEDNISLFAATLDGVANGVEKADYAPTGLGTYVCNYCPVQAICGPYQRYKEVTNA
jgi:hypothetical protein